MTRSRGLLIGFKMIVALVGLSALMTEIATLVERGRFHPVNFLSFFTVEGNILVAVCLIVSAIAVAAGTNERLSAVRGAVTVYILVVGIGFAALLSGLKDVDLTAVPWTNAVLHYGVPAAALIDFLIDRPAKLPFVRSLVWLAYPVAYAAYSLIRGAATGYYPYPFLNPATHGSGAVAFSIAGLLVLGLVLLAAVTWLSGRRGLAAPAA